MLLKITDQSEHIKMLYVAKIVSIYNGPIRRDFVAKNSSTQYIRTRLGSQSHSFQRISTDNMNNRKERQEGFDQTLAEEIEESSRLLLEDGEWDP